MRAACIQFDIVRGDVDRNMAIVEQRVEALMRQDAPPDVITLPELWSTGYDLKRMRELATPMGEREADFLSGLARRWNVAFSGGSVLSLEEGRVFNRAQVIDAEGRVLGGYNKIHLFRPTGEDTWLEQGKHRFLFDLCGMRCACIVCYDLRFCELARRLALDGAQVLFVSAEWMAPRLRHWLLLLQARAIENQMFVVACNCSGATRSVRFVGHSMLVAPDGRILAQAGEEAETICAEFDRTAVMPFDVFRDRVPEMY